MIKNIIFILLLLSGTAFATDYYVDQGASDELNDCAGGAGTSYRFTERDCGGSGGTISWDTITECEANMARGDTCVVRNGTYNERVTVNVAASSTATLTFECVSGETCTMGEGASSAGFYIDQPYVIIDGNRTGTDDGFVITNQPGGTGYHIGAIRVSATGDNSIIRECVLLNSQRSGVQVEEGGDGTTVQNNYFYHNAGNGIDIQADNCDVLNNDIREPTNFNYNQSYDCDCIRVHGSGHLVSENYCYISFGTTGVSETGHCDGIQTFVSDGTISAMSNTTVEYNYFYCDEPSGNPPSVTSQGYATSIRMAENAYNNIIRYNISEGWYRFLASDVGNPAVGVDNLLYVYGNTAIGHAGLCSEYGRTSCWPIGIQFDAQSDYTNEVFNNIIVDFDYRSINYINGSDVSSGYNITYQTDTDNPVCSGTTNADCKQTGDQYATNPLFTNFGARNFTLSSSSTAIDNGVTIGTSGNQDDALTSESTWPDSITTDIQGDNGTGWEIGAYVYGSAGAVLNIPGNLTISSGSLNIN